MTVITWTRGPRDRYPVAHLHMQISLSVRDVQQLLDRDTEGRGLEAVVTDLVVADLDLEKMIEGRLDWAQDRDGPLAEGRPVCVSPAQRRRSSFDIPASPPAWFTADAPSGDEPADSTETPLPTEWQHHTVVRISKPEPSEPAAEPEEPGE